MSRVQENIRLGVFDINGTIQSEKDGVPASIISGFQNLHEQQILSTVITGRSLARARELLAGDWSSIVSGGMPVSVENGARLVSEHSENLQFHPIDSATVDCVIDATAEAEDEVRYLGFSPKDPNADNVLWIPSHGSPEEYVKANGNNTQVITGNLSKFASRIAVEKACMIRVGSRSREVIDLIGGPNVFVNQAELNVLPSGIHKGSGVAEIAEYAGIPLAEVLVAGNDQNDLPMLSLGVAKSILVVDGNLELDDISPMTQSVSSPNELGRLLSRI